MRISVITTKRAYDELEREGFIYTIAAKGCFVAPKNLELIREQNLKKIEEYMRQIIKISASLKLNKQDIIQILDILFEEDGSDGCC